MATAGREQTTRSSCAHLATRLQPGSDSPTPGNPLYVERPHFVPLRARGLASLTCHRRPQPARQLAASHGGVAASFRPSRQWRRAQPAPLLLPPSGSAGDRLRLVHFGSQRPVKEVRGTAALVEEQSYRPVRLPVVRGASHARPGGVGSCHGKRLSRAATSLLAAWSGQGPGLNGCWSCPHLVPCGGSLVRIR